MINIYQNNSNNNNNEDTYNEDNIILKSSTTPIYSGSENYMIVSRVLSNEDDEEQQDNIKEIDGEEEYNNTIIPDENGQLKSPREISPLIKSLTSSDDTLPIVISNFKGGYSNFKTPTNSDTESEDDNDNEEYEETEFKLKRTNISQPINIRNSSDDFETIEIKVEDDNEIYQQQLQQQLGSSLSPPQPSPFKLLLTNKLRSIKDKIENSPSNDNRYNTFPIDRYNNIPSSDISLFSSSPAHDIILINKQNNNNSSNNNHNNHNNSNSIGSNNSLNSGIISSQSSLSISNNGNNGGGNLHDYISSRSNTMDNFNYGNDDTFDTDSHYSNRTIDGGGVGSDIIDLNKINHNNLLIRMNSNSSITRPVLLYERTKVNYKILTLLSLSVFFSVSNLYYAQPLLNEFVNEFNISNSIASLITMSVQFGYALGLSFISILGDIISKKKLTLILSMITCAALIGIGVSPHIIPVIIFHFIVGVSTIIPYIAIPLALDMTNPNDRSGIVGVLLSSVFVGLLGARVLSGLISYLFGWRVVFYFAAVTMFIISILLFYFLPYTPRTQNIIPYNKLLISVYEFLMKEKVLRYTCFIGAMIFATFSILWTTLTFRLNEEPYNYNSVFIGLCGLIGMAGAISSPLSGRLAERFGINRLMIVYLIICAGGYLLLMFLDSHIIGLIAGIFILDLGVQSCHISNQSRNNLLSSSLLDESSKYNINTIYMASYFIGGSIGSGISGVVYSHWNWVGSSIVALCFLGAALCFHLITYEPPTFVSVPIED